MSDSLKNILAIDIGLRTGWATMHGEATEYGSISFKLKGTDGKNVYNQFIRWLHDIKAGKDIKCVFWCNTSSMRSSKTGCLNAKLVQQLQAWCVRQEINCKDVPFGTVRRHIMGRSIASQEAIMLAILDLDYCPTNCREANALAVLTTAVGRGMTG